MHITDKKRRRPKRRNRDKAADSESEPSTIVPPCRHNKWFRIRKAKEFVRLACLEKDCGLTWKTDLSAHTKCEDFYTGSCLKDTQCEHPHIYSRFHLKKFRIDVSHMMWDDESNFSHGDKARSEDLSDSCDDEQQQQQQPPQQAPPPPPQQQQGRPPRQDSPPVPAPATSSAEHPQEMWRRLMGPLISNTDDQEACT